MILPDYLDRRQTEDDPHEQKLSRDGLQNFLIALILILGASLLFGVVWAPARAKDLFGPADPSLNILQRSRSALALLSAKEELLNGRPLGGKSGKFAIAEDESVRSICLRLKTEGYVASAEAVCTF